MSITSSSAADTNNADLNSEVQGDANIDAKSESKAIFKRLLLQHNGEASHPEVIASLTLLHRNEVVRIGIPLIKLNPSLDDGEA